MEPQGQQGFWFTFWLVLEGLTASVTRKAMLAAQIGEKLSGGSGTPGSYILVAVTDALDGLCEVLAFPLKVGDQSIVEGRGRVLSAPFGVLFQLRLTLRLERDHINGGLCSYGYRKGFGG